MSGRSIVVSCVVAIAASLLLARAHPFGDAGLYAQTRTAPILQHSDVPSNVRETLMTKCADCHSTQTHAPLYGHFAPFSWLMERDIVAARGAMNLSQWESYSDEDREAFKVKMLLETKSRHMPLPQYRLIHWDAQITRTEIDAFSQWARQSSDGDASPTTAATNGGDASRGRAVFERRCTGCHSLDQNREGPCLRGVFGRVSGSVSDFGYSTAVKQAHITWNEISLERWLTGPDSLVPGTDMDFHVAKAQERTDLIAFLKQSAAK